MTVWRAYDIDPEEENESGLVTCWKQWGDITWYVFLVFAILCSIGSLVIVMWLKDNTLPSLSTETTRLLEQTAAFKKTMDLASEEERLYDQVEEYLKPSAFIKKIVDGEVDKVFGGKKGEKCTPCDEMNGKVMKSSINDKVRELRQLFVLGKTGEIKKMMKLIGTTKKRKKWMDGKVDEAWKWWDKTIWFEALDGENEQPKSDNLIPPKPTTDQLNDLFPFGESRLAKAIEEDWEPAEKIEDSSKTLKAYPHLQAYKIELKEARETHKRRMEFMKAKLPKEIVTVLQAVARIQVVATNLEDKKERMKKQVREGFLGLKTAEGQEKGVSRTSTWPTEAEVAELNEKRTGNPLEDKDLGPEVRFKAMMETEIVTFFSDKTNLNELVDSGTRETFLKIVEEGKNIPEKIRKALQEGRLEEGCVDIFQQCKVLISQQFDDWKEQLREGVKETSKKGIGMLVDAGLNYLTGGLDRPIYREIRSMVIKIKNGVKRLRMINVVEKDDGTLQNQGVGMAMESILETVEYWTIWLLYLSAGSVGMWIVCLLVNIVIGCFCFTNDYCLGRWFGWVWTMLLLPTLGILITTAVFSGILFFNSVPALQTVEMRVKMSKKALKSTSDVIEETMLKEIQLHKITNIPNFDVSVEKAKEIIKMGIDGLCSLVPFGFGNGIAVILKLALEFIIPPAVTALESVLKGTLEGLISKASKMAGDFIEKTLLIKPITRPSVVFDRELFSSLSEELWVLLLIIFVLSNTAAGFLFVLGLWSLLMKCHSMYNEKEVTQDIPVARIPPKPTMHDDAAFRGCRTLGLNY